MNYNQIEKQQKYSVQKQLISLRLTPLAYCLLPKRPWKTHMFYTLFISFEIFLLCNIQYSNIESCRSVKVVTADTQTGGIILTIMQNKKAIKSTLFFFGGQTVRYTIKYNKSKCTKLITHSVQAHLDKHYSARHDTLTKI